MYVDYYTLWHMAVNEDAQISDLNLRVTAYFGNDNERMTNDNDNNIRSQFNPIVQSLQQQNGCRSKYLRNRLGTYLYITS